MEQWDIYDKCFVKTGRTHERGKTLEEGDYHLVVHIYPINSKGQILIQKGPILLVGNLDFGLQPEALQFLGMMLGLPVKRNYGRS